MRVVRECRRSQGAQQKDSEQDGKQVLFHGSLLFVFVSGEGRIPFFCDAASITQTGEKRKPEIQKDSATSPKRAAVFAFPLAFSAFLW
jgi:hypothetical protein